jgi:putative addiction module killer protein
MNVLVQSSVFEKWLHKLKDHKAKAAVLRRMADAEAGNFGDCKPVREGVSEMRIHMGPGYRVYFMREGKTVYVLLCGGDKKGQARDIDAALAMAKQWKEERDG